MAFRVRARSMGRAKLAMTLAIGLVTVLLAVAATASAAVHYCSSCKIYNYPANKSTAGPLTVTSNYVHYLGSGNRLMGSSVGGGSISWAVNTAHFGYVAYYARAFAWVNCSCSYATSNAHAN